MDFELNGFEVESNFINDELIKGLVGDIEKLDAGFPKHGLRNAEKKLPSVLQLVSSARLINKAKEYLTGTPSLVRVIIFDKTPDKNWLVTWHQDKTVSVSERVHIDGWGPWTLKDEIHHVQPESRVLDQMVTFRLHLDDADEDNGCLKVIPQSHNLGILSQTRINEIIEESTPHICSANAGDLLVMKPLLLHASSKGSKPSHRRVVHVEYSCFELPNGLEWR